MNYKKELLRSPASITGPPECCGVYGVFMSSPKSSEETLLYIGSSANMRQRLMCVDHFYRKFYAAFSNDYTIYTRCVATKDYIIVEKELIKYFKPIFNKNGK